MRGEAEQNSKRNGVRPREEGGTKALAVRSAFAYTRARRDTQQVEAIPRSTCIFRAARRGGAGEVAGPLNDRVAASGICLDCGEED